MSIDLTDMTDEQLYELIEAAQTELGKRQTRDVFDRELAEVVQKGRESGVIETPEVGEEYDPSKVYSLGDVTTRDGQRYESLHPYNVWTPGDESNPVHWTLWKLLTEPETGETGYELWSGLGVKYAAGDVHEHDGQVWEALQAHTSQPDWAPGIAHSLWKLVSGENGDEPEGGNTEPAELPEWDGNAHNYTTGDTFTYEGTPYRVRQDHTSQPHYTPDQVPALYEPGTYEG